MIHRVIRYQKCYCGRDKRKSSSGSKYWEEWSFMSTIKRRHFSYSNHRDHSNRIISNSNSGISYEQKLNIIGETC